MTRTPPHSRKRQAGFSLIELMVTIAIFAILVGVAIPGFQSTLTSSRLASAGNALIGGIQGARMEAIRRNQSVRFCLNATTHAWQIMDASSNILSTDTIASGIALKTDKLDTSSVQGQACVRFGGDGMPYSSGNSTALISAGTIELALNGSAKTVNIKVGSIYVQ